MEGVYHLYMCVKYWSVGYRKSHVQISQLLVFWILTFQSHSRHYDTVYVSGANIFNTNSSGMDFAAPIRYYGLSKQVNAVNEWEFFGRFNGLNLHCRHSLNAGHP